MGRLDASQINWDKGTPDESNCEVDRHMLSFGDGHFILRVRRQREWRWRAKTESHDSNSDGYARLEQRYDGAEP
jgi:hypothetical protein